MGQKTLQAFILLLFATFRVHAWFHRIDQPPFITKQPPSTELLYHVASDSENDKPFVIECEAEGEPAPKYRWTKNGKRFDPSEYESRISQQYGSGTLVISQPRDEDAGYYQCFAENVYGIASSNVVFVRKAVLNSFKDDLPNFVTALLGEPFDLQCKAPDGWPMPKIYWIIQNSDGDIKKINDSRITVDPLGNLHFSNVTFNDESDYFYYVCVVTSSFSNEYRYGNRIHLEVEQPRLSLTPNLHKPILQYVTQNNEVALRGKRVELFCIFGGTPLPQIKWTKYGQPIYWNDRVTQGNFGKSIIIRHARFEDAGSYSCEASNGVGKAQTHSIQLKVNALPSFTVEPEIRIAAENENVEFNCEASGVPEPEVKWTFNGKPIALAAPNPRRVVETNRILIKNVKAKDTGNYGCNATNSLGHIYKDVYLNVLALPAAITEPPRRHATVEGRTVTLRCRAFGAPSPKVKWIHNGIELTGGRYQTQSNGDVIIKNVSFADAGEYTCHAQNDNGQAEATGLLFVKKHTEIIEPPLDYEVAAGNSATFRCNALTDVSLDLQIKWLFDGEEIDFANEPRFWLRNDNSLYISKINERDFGVYTCVASTELDEERASATLIVQDVPFAPQLTGVTCYDKHAFISWKPRGGQSRSPILHYSVEHSSSSLSNSWSVIYDKIPATDSNRMIEMSPWRNYTFRVVAVNKIGSSPPTEPSESCITQPDVPYKNPENVKGEGTLSTNLVISWTPIPEIEHNGPRFQYRVYWKRDIPDAKWNVVDVYDWRQEKIVIENQPTFVRYRIKVIAVNQLGESNKMASEVIGYSGEAQPTQAPTNFTVVQLINGTSAILSWNQISSDAITGHFKGYKIQFWSEFETEQHLREFHVKDDINEVLITKFQPDAINYARILAFNRYDGIASDVIEFKTLKKDPSQSSVQTLDAFPLSSSSFLLRWKKPLMMKGQLSGYRVFYEEINGTIIKKRIERDPQIDCPKATQTKLTGLTPNTKYRLHVIPLTKTSEGEDYFIDIKTSEKDEQSTTPDRPDFKYEQLPSTDFFGGIKVKWLPNVNGNPGTHFFAKYRQEGASMWSETDYVLDEDSVDITDLLEDEVYEVAVVSVDGEYMTESNVQKIPLTSNAKK